MQVNGTTPPSIPFHVARAYGVTPPVKPVTSPPSTAPVQQVAPTPEPAKTPGMQRLVAGVVPGGVDFDQPQPGVKGAGLPFYTNPADTNAAVTNVNLGRGIDVTA